MNGRVLNRWLFASPNRDAEMAMNMLELHTSIYQSLRSKYNDLPRIREVLENLKTEHADLVKDEEVNTVVSSKCFEMREAIASLETTIEHVESFSAEAEYFRDCKDFLNTYHHLQSTLNYNRINEKDEKKAEEVRTSTTEEISSLTTSFKQRFRPDLIPSNTPHLEMVQRCQKDTYKRINHFREYLRQIQGKSRGNIPPVLVERVREELRKRRVAEWQVKPVHVRRILKRIKQAKYYEHVIHITSSINKCFQSLDIPEDRVELLCARFMDTERPFNQIKTRVNKHRKNFLSYPFVMYKLCELMGWDEYLDDLKLLQPDLLIPQDEWWKLICAQLNWQFLRTVGSIDSLRPNGFDL